MNYEEQVKPYKVYLGADHAGFELKEIIQAHLDDLGYQTEDMGAYEYEPDDDYPDFVGPVAQMVAQDAEAIGIILGGSGQGEAIAANRFPNVRAVVFNGQYVPDDGRDVPHEIITARQHNNANILSLGARFLNKEEALEAVDAFIETDFSHEERHIRRINKLNQFPG